MTRRIYKFIFALSVFFAGASAFGVMLEDPQAGYYLDFPEGFQMDDMAEDGSSYLFSHPETPVQAALRIYSGEEFTDSASTLQMALGKLSAEGDIDSFEWSGENCAITNFSMTLDKKYNGWALCAPLKNMWHGFITLLCYAPEADAEGWNQFMVSVVNSLCIKSDYYNSPGPVLSYAFPKTQEQKVTLEIDGKTITASLDVCDKEASEFLVELEYSVLFLYANHRLWKEAWERYYRLIYRDSFGRLEKVSQQVLDTLYPLAEQENPDNPRVCYAQKLLTWVQGFEYKRQNESARQTDFTSLPAVLLGEGNDCDSRSLLVCTFLKAAGIESLLLVSAEYSHAMVAAELNAPGQTYKLSGIENEFLMGETTAKVTWGMIAENQADRSKWIPVILP